MEATERTFISWDGAELFYRSWLPSNPTDKALLLFHRGHEHSGRWQETVDSLEVDDVAIFAWDARGHGQRLVHQERRRVTDDRPATAARRTVFST